MNCEYCKKIIRKGQQTIQVRLGYMEEDDFEPEEDLGYYHALCHAKSQK